MVMNALAPLRNFHAGGRPAPVEKYEPAAVGCRRLIDLRHQAPAKRPVDLRDHLIRTRGRGGKGSLGSVAQTTILKWSQQPRNLPTAGACGIMNALAVLAGLATDTATTIDKTNDIIIGDVTI